MAIKNSWGAKIQAKVERHPTAGDILSTVVPRAQAVAMKNLSDVVFLKERLKIGTGRYRVAAEALGMDPVFFERFLKAALAEVEYPADLFHLNLLTNRSKRGK